MEKGLNQTENLATSPTNLRLIWWFDLIWRLHGFFFFLWEHLELGCILSILSGCTRNQFSMVLCVLQLILKVLHVHASTLKQFWCFYWKHVQAKHIQLRHDFSEAYFKRWDSWKAFRLFWKESHGFSLQHMFSLSFCTCRWAWKASFVECNNTCPPNFSLLGTLK